MLKVGQSSFKKLFTVGETEHLSLEGLLRHPLIVTAILKGNFVGRRGRLLRYDAATKTYDTVILAKVIGSDNATNKLKLSTYDGIATGNYKAILADGSAVSLAVSQVQAPAYDVLSTLQINEDFVVIADPDGAGPLDVADIKYLAPDTAVLNTKISGIVHEDSTGVECGLAVAVEGAKVSQVYGADIPALAEALGLKVMDDLVFFQVA